MREEQHDREPGDRASSASGSCASEKSDSASMTRHSDIHRDRGDPELPQRAGPDERQEREVRQREPDRPELHDVVVRAVDETAGDREVRAASAYSIVRSWADANQAAANPTTIAASATPGMPVRAVRRRCRRGAGSRPGTHLGSGPWTGPGRIGRARGASSARSGARANASTTPAVRPIDCPSTRPARPLNGNACPRTAGGIVAYARRLTGSCLL